MDNVRLRIQVDFGVGDVMRPGPRLLEYPALLDSDTIQPRAYPIESAIAEKLQAMVALGSTNSRMKDFYDVWICANNLDFDTDTLLDAIGATFNNRKTSVPADDFEALTDNFADQHGVQRNAFVRKIGEDELMDALGKVVTELRSFALPLLRSLARSEPLAQQWKAGSGWIPRSKRRAPKGQL